MSQARNHTEIAIMKEKTGRWARSVAPGGRGREHSTLNKAGELDKNVSEDLIRNVLFWERFDAKSPTCLVFVDLICGHWNRIARIRAKDPI